MLQRSTNEVKGHQPHGYCAAFFRLGARLSRATLPQYLIFLSSSYTNEDFIRWRRKSSSENLSNCIPKRTQQATHGKAWIGIEGVILKTNVCIIISIAEPPQYNHLL